MEYDLSVPTNDFNAANAALVEALKTAKAKKDDNSFLDAKKYGEYSFGPSIGDFIAGQYNRSKGEQEYAKALSDQQSLAGEQQTRLKAITDQLRTPGTKTQTYQPDGPMPDGNAMPEQSQTVPMSTEEENQRQMGLGFDAMTLPMGEKIGAEFVKSGVGYPEKVADSKFKYAQLAQQQADRLQRAREQAQTAEDGRNARAEAANTNRMLVASMAAQARAAGRSGQSKPPSGYRWGEDGETLVPISGGPADPNGKPKKLRAAEVKNIHEANLGMQSVDDAIAKLEHPAAKGATGPLNLIPGAEIARQYTGTPEQIAARAALSNIGSLKLHDRSGATITASEFPRLAPFIPSTADTPTAAAAKLKNLKAEYKRMSEEWSSSPTAGRGDTGSEEPTPTPAPDSAIKFLKDNPGKASAFKAKYGYLPKEL